MTNTYVYCDTDDACCDVEDVQYKVRDRVSDKRIEKRERQARARKNTKKGTRNVTQIRKGTVARDVRASRPREVSLLRESNND